MITRRTVLTQAALGAAAVVSSIGLARIPVMAQTRRAPAMSAIDDKYAALGGPGGFLGHPVDEGAGSDEMPTADGRGRVRDFQGGSIYWTPNTGAHEVHGAIRDHWASMGWETSFLRYPTMDERPDGNGRFSQFQGGSLHWTPDGRIDVRQRID